MSKSAKRYALLVPAVALASIAAVNRADAGGTPSLTNSSPTTEVTNNLLPELGSANSAIIAAAGFATADAFENDGTVDPDAPVDVITSSSDSQPLMLDVTASDGSTPTLTGGGSQIIQSTIEGQPGDGKFDYIYNGLTGDISIAYDGDPNITGAKPLQRLKLASLGGRFITTNFNGSGFGTATSTNTLIDAAQAQGSIPDHYDLGNVLPVGLDKQTLLSDLTLNWQVLNGGLGVRNGNLVVPEPTALGLIGVSALGLLARRRKTSKQ